MNKINTQGKFIIVGIIIVLILIFIVMGMAGKPAPGSPTAQNGGNTNGQTGEPAAPVSPTAAAPAPAPIPVLHLVNPVPNDQWKLGKSNPILWDKEAGVTGEIDLLDAKTNAVVGVILSEIAPHQTSYTWDTRQIALQRYSPLKKDIVPGTYLIRLKFDGNNVAAVTSGPITVQ